MKHSEYALFFDPTLNPMARNLYMALRYCADYKTGIACVSYSKLIDLVRFQPTNKSKSEPINPTTKQIRVWLSALEERGLIEKHKAGNAMTGASASWVLVEMKKGTQEGHAQTQQPQGLQADEGHETRAQEGHKKGTQEGHDETQQTQGLQPDEGHDQNTQEGHISIRSLKNNIYERHARESNFEGEFEEGMNAEQISLDNQFILAARSVGQTLAFDDLNLIFIDFQNNKHNRYKNQSRADWLADWRSWCAKSKLYHNRSLTNATNKHAGHSSRPVSKAEVNRNIFEFARAAAAKLANSED